MKIVAVIELDRWAKQLNVNASTEATAQALVGVVGLYKQCHTVDAWAFSLTYDKRFAPLMDILSELGIELQPKDCLDPLNAFYELVGRSLSASTRANHSDIVIRLAANERFLECTVIDAMVENHIEKSLHYSRNRLEQPDHGTEIEIMNFSVLREAWQEALLPDDRLQITPYIYRQHQRLNLGLFPAAANTIFHA